MPFYTPLQKKIMFECESIEERAKNRSKTPNNVFSWIYTPQETQRLKELQELYNKEKNKYN